MKVERTNKSIGLSTPHYIIMYKLYVLPDGSLVVIMGNTRMEVSPDETHALLCGVLDIASVFAALHKEVDATTLAILNENGHIGTLRGKVD